MVSAVLTSTLTCLPLQGDTKELNSITKHLSATPMQSKEMSEWLLTLSECASQLTQSHNELVDCALVSKHWTAGFGEGNERIVLGHHAVVTWEISYTAKHSRLWREVWGVGVWPRVLV